MRVLLDKKSRKFLFKYLKQNTNSSTYRELAKNKNWSFSNIRKWRNAERYIPLDIIPKDIENKLRVIDKKENNWGCVKGGKIGGVNSIKLQKEKYGEERFREIRKKCGKGGIQRLWNIYSKEEVTKMCIKGKIRRRERISKRLEEQNLSFFINKEVKLKNSDVMLSKIDIKRKIRFPKVMSKELAEEIGAHLGDGCMSLKRNYFSIRTNRKEKGYISYLSTIYKHLYNIELKLKDYDNTYGFEICSKGLCNFKNKVIGLPFGEKKGNIKVPSTVIRTKNRDIYCALIRGLFDTDGCIYLKNKKYPRVSITVKSEELLNDVTKMLRLMGYLPRKYEDTIVLNGPVMLNKWIKEINSNNPVKKEKLERASSIAWTVRGSAV